MGKVPLAAAISLKGFTSSSGTVANGGVAGTDYVSDNANAAAMVSAGGSVSMSGWSTAVYLSSCFHGKLGALTDRSWLEVYNQANTLLAEVKVKSDGHLELFFGGVSKGIVEIDTAIHRYCLRADTIGEDITLLIDNTPALFADLLDYTGTTSLARLTWKGDCAVSAVIVDNEDTVSRYTRPIPFDAAGSLSGLTGSLADIEDDDEDTGLEGEAGDISTFTHDAIVTSGSVEAVCVTGQVALNVGDLTGFTFLARVGGVNYEATPNLTDTVNLAGFDANPVDDTDWTITTVNGAEFGFKGV